MNAVQKMFNSFLKRPAVFKDENFLMRNRRHFVGGDLSISPSGARSQEAFRKIQNGHPLIALWESRKNRCHFTCGISNISDQFARGSVYSLGDFFFHLGGPPHPRSLLT